MTVAAWIAVFLDGKEDGERSRSVKNARTILRTHVGPDPFGGVELRRVTARSAREWWARVLVRTATVPAHMPARSEDAAGAAPVRVDPAQHPVAREDGARRSAGAGVHRIESPARDARAACGVKATTAIALDGVLEYRVTMAAVFFAKARGARVEGERRSAVGGARGARDGLRVAMGTGLRRGELLALRWEDVDLGDRPHLRVRHGRRGGGPTKGGRARRVPLFGAALDALLAWRAGGVLAARHGEPEFLKRLDDVERVQRRDDDLDLVDHLRQLHAGADGLRDGLRLGQREDELLGHGREDAARGEPSQVSRPVFPGPLGGWRKFPPVGELRAARLDAAGVDASGALA